MAVKELFTRIALKYDTYERWMDPEVGGKLVLLKGEIGLCEIPSGSDQATNAPTVLFKVGDGEHTFSQLQWASAKAADVYTWAKASDVTYDKTAKTITFVGGAVDAEGKKIDKVFTFDYVTATEVDNQIKAITNPLASKITDLEGKFGETGEITTTLADYESRLDTIEGEGEGSIKKAAQEAQAAAEATAASKASAAETAAKEHATGLNTAMDNRVKPLEAAKTDHESRIGNAESAITAINTVTIPGVEAAFEAADKAITDTIGGSYNSTDTVDKAIKAAKQAADNAQADFNELTKENGRIAQVESKATANAGAIEQLGKDLEAEAKARGDKDTELEGRLNSVEAFFEVAEGEKLDTALDTLKEIQDYLNGEGEATGGVIGRVAKAEQDIDNLEKEFAAGGRVTKAEGEITGLKGRVDTVEATIAGYNGTDTIKKAVDKAQEDATQGIEDAAAAKEAADKAQEDVDALEKVVGDANSGLVQLVNTVKGTADSASSDATRANGRLDTAEGEIDALQATVLKGDDSNAKLRSAITSLQEITGSDSANGNAKLREDINAIDAQINTASTGILARLTSAEGKISAVEGNYLKADDAYIFQCGDASAPNHMPAQN